ncbi:response regulator [Flavobacterium sp. Sd200]|uniref:LytR/AlgR family response regulator transcription factor n=1 Tax=Flavobacterium sp. Sd200 TaxID=2692211 RepID=UPI00136D1062|nr:LytTR family DNA-binding domain-containing protein [Flavobacterium sp. Sd200]MXN91200.1 response regulator [Flavobacterium sp. Sd200]
MNCIIVDDEPLARQGMQELIEEVSDIKIVGMFSNAPAALAFLKDNKTDLVFLDIQMPKVTGLEFAEQIPAQTLIIFTTAYSQYALKSYELDAVDYLLKPIEKDRLEKAINKAVLYKKLLSDETEKSVVEKAGNEFLVIKADRRYYKINFEDILFIEGLKDYVVLYTKIQKLITAMNLKTIQQKLPVLNFMRVSKSYIVNLAVVDSFDSHNLYIAEHEISLGEVYKNEFVQRYLNE